MTTTDPFGNKVITKRPPAKILRVPFMMEASAHSAVDRILARYRAENVVWVASPLLSMLTTYGFPSSHEIVPGKAKAKGTVEIQGMV